MKILSFLKNNMWARYIAILVAGIAIGAVFYPSKNMEETVKQKYEQEIISLKSESATRLSDLQVTYTSEVQKLTEKNAETERKLLVSATEIKDLKSKQKTSYYKLVKPDGTVEIKKFTESEVNESSKTVIAIQQEYKQKVQEIETKWERIHLERVSKINETYNLASANYQKTINELEKKTKIEINPKKYGIAVGYLTSQSYYMSAEADVFGPVYVQAHGQTGLDNALGGAIGIRF